MAPLDQAFKELWQSVKQIRLNPEAAIYQEWRRRHQEWGAPITNEKDLDEGGVYQVFTHAIVRWTEERGVEVITE